MTLAYNPTAQTLVETLTDSTIPSDTFSYTYTDVSLSSVLGGNGTAYVGFSGGTGGGTATQQISNFTYTTDNYSNAVVLGAGSISTIDVDATADAPTITMGPLTVNSGSGTTLDITDSMGPSNNSNGSYGLTLGNVSLLGNVNINVAANGSGTGTLRLGACRMILPAAAIRSRSTPAIPTSPPPRRPALSR